MTQRHLGHAEIEGAYQWLGEIAVAHVNKGHEHPSLVLLLQMSAAKPGDIERCIPAPPEMDDAFSSPENKDLLGQLIRTLLSPSPLRSKLERVGSAPDIVAVLSEAWMVQQTVKKREPFPDMVPHAHPERQEALVIVLNTVDGTYCGSSPIETVDGKRRVALVPLWDRGTLEGRLIMQGSSEVPADGTRQ